MEGVVALILVFREGAPPVGGSGLNPGLTWACEIVISRRRSQIPFMEVVINDYEVQEK